MTKCTECDQKFSKAGLHGHLRFSHGLRGQELKEVYRESISRRADEQESGTEQVSELPEVGQKTPEEDEEAADQVEETGGESYRELPKRPALKDREREERAPSRTTEGDVMHAADRLREAKMRLQALRDEIGEGAGTSNDEEDDGSRRGGVVSKGLRELFGSEQESQETEGPSLSEAKRECLQRCREDVEEARNCLAEMLKKRQAEHEHGRSV